MSILGRPAQRVDDEYFLRASGPFNAQTQLFAHRREQRRVPADRRVRVQGISGELQLHVEATLQRRSVTQWAVQLGADGSEHCGPLGADEAEVDAAVVRQ